LAATGSFLLLDYATYTPHSGHQPAPLLKQIAPLIGAFGIVTDHMRQGRFSYLAEPSIAPRPKFEKWRESRAP
jgi:hypothetical protein